MKNSNTNCRCLIRDFNEMRGVGERKGRSVYHISANSWRFGEFIDEAGLTDVLLVGRKFT